MHSRNAFLNKGEYNVIVVDWERGANTPIYSTARNRVSNIGVVLAQFIDFLNGRGLAFSRVDIIGHSLGAHIAGIAGKLVSRGRINAIVGLEPALLGFSADVPAERLHITDAIYVEVMYTDMGRISANYPIGHANFFPNFGRGQPGCGIDLTGSCGHSRSWQFYGETISHPNTFWATMCSGFIAIETGRCPPAGPNQLMGGDPVNQGANGMYFLQTNSETPFGQGWR